MGSLRDAILAAEDLPTEEVATPEWAPFGVPTVRVRGLTASDREKYERSLVTYNSDGTTVVNTKATDVRARFCSLVIVDPDTGDLAFQQADVKELAAKSALVIERIFDTGRRLSGMTAEEAEENPSEGDQDDSDSSDSP